LLRLGGQRDGQAPGGDVVDSAVLAVGGGDAVGDETLVEDPVGQRFPFRNLGAAPGCRASAAP
jgi:hypothetical protein